MNKRSKKQFNELKKQNCISVNAFLTKYCGIYDENILNLKITSKQLKTLFPYLKNVSYDKVLENPKEVYIGNILLIKDYQGNVVPYFKPQVITDGCITFNIQKEEEKDNFTTAVSLENLSDYQLDILCKRYKEIGRMSEYRKVCHIIISRRTKSNVRKYKAKKEKILIKQKEVNYE